MEESVEVGLNGIALTSTCCEAYFLSTLGGCNCDVCLSISYRCKQEKFRDLLLDPEILLTACEHFEDDKLVVTLFQSWKDIIWNKTIPVLRLSDELMNAVCRRRSAVVIRALFAMGIKIPPVHSVLSTAVEGGSLEVIRFCLYEVRQCGVPLFLPAIQAAHLQYFDILRELITFSPKLASFLLRMKDTKVFSYHVLRFLVDMLQKVEPSLGTWLKTATTEKEHIISANLVQVLAELGACLVDNQRLFEVSKEYLDLDLGRSLHYQYTRKAQEEPQNDATADKPTTNVDKYHNQHVVAMQLLFESGLPYDFINTNTDTRPLTKKMLQLCVSHGQSSLQPFSYSSTAQYIPGQRLLRFSATRDIMILTLFEWQYYDVMHLCFASYPNMMITFASYMNCQTIGRALAIGGKDALEFLIDFTIIERHQQLLNQLWLESYNFEVIHLLLLCTDWQHDVYVVDNSNTEYAKKSIFQVMSESLAAMNIDHDRQKRIDEYKILLPLLLRLPAARDMDLEFTAVAFEQSGGASMELAAIIRSSSS